MFFFKFPFKTSHRRTIFNIRLQDIRRHTIVFLLQVIHDCHMESVRIVEDGGVPLAGAFLGVETCLGGHGFLESFVSVVIPVIGE